MKLIALAAVVALAGCSSLVQVTSPGAHHKETSLKSAYKKETGQDLPEPEISPLCMDYACYTEAWKESYEKNIKLYRDNKQAIEAASEAKRKEQQSEQDRICSEKPGCMKEREITKHSSNAIESYNYFTDRYAGNGDEYDYISRRMCDRIITEQKKVPL